MNALRLISREKWSSALAAVALLVILPAGGAAQDAGNGATPYMAFDTDRQMWLYDSDGDGSFDLSEELRGTDPFDPASHLFNSEDLQEKVGFPKSGCQEPTAHYRQAGRRLCISKFPQAADWFDNAAVKCRERQARICTYEDLYYVYINISFDPVYSPVDRATNRARFIGNLVGENTVLCGDRHIDFNNDPDIFDFAGECPTNAGPSGSVRQYWCCFDDDRDGV